MTNSTPSWYPIGLQVKSKKKRRVDDSLFCFFIYIKEAASQRAATAASLRTREKLTKLTEQQFYELSTDVYDETIRRKTAGAHSLTTSSHFTIVPSLPPQSDFVPNRNLARQKLSTLPSTRFQDLASDVWVELVRRYPGVKEHTFVSVCPFLSFFLYYCNFIFFRRCKLLIKWTRREIQSG
jgi:protein SPA2